MGTLRRECLDHLLILGEQHLREIPDEYAQHDKRHRPHQGLQQSPPLNRGGKVTDFTARIKCGRAADGLISEYHRAV